MRTCLTCGYHNVDAAVYCAFCRQPLPPEGEAAGMPLPGNETDARPMDESSRMAMGHIRWPRLQTVIMTLLMAAILIVGGVLSDQLFGPSKVQRDHTLQLMQKEMGLLPPFKDSQQLQTLKTNVPFHAAQLEVDYSTYSTCSDVMDYYFALEQELGWYVLAPQVAYPAGGPTAEEYGRFMAQGTTIYVNVQCAITQTVAGSYAVTMRTDNWATPPV